MPATKYVFKYRALDPRKLRPNGDRYLFEVLATDEEALPSGLYLPDAIEEKKGWFVGVVFSHGNGHRLDTPDVYLPLPEKYECDPDFDPDVDWGDSTIVRRAKIAAGKGSEIDHGDSAETRLKKRQARMQRRQQFVNSTNIVTIGDSVMVGRYPAAVPMFYQIGEVIFVEKYSGRPMIIGGREFRVVNQVDTLCSSGVFLRLLDDGETWEERDLEAEAKAAQEMAQARQHMNGKRIILP